MQDIRRADGKGRHTTAFRNLVPVPGGGAVIDTPGIRGVGLLDTAVASTRPSRTSPSWPRTAGSVTAGTTPSRAVRWSRRWPTGR